MLFTTQLAWNMPLLPDPTTGALRQMDSKSNRYDPSQVHILRTPWRSGNNDLAVLWSEFIFMVAFVIRLLNRVAAAKFCC